ncbi:MAG TPA: J domain-containing protein [Sphingomicrobium sp.]|nr:J domain-containing protein [Sphingomicrobium sp.]
MARDHYEVLGVAPTSEDVVIRAAYRALMRRYHPDKGPAADMSGRALEINAAYAVLGDPDKRARYDGSLAAAGLVKPNAEQRRRLSMTAVRRPGPTAAAAFATLGGLLLIFALSPPFARMPGAPVVLGQGAGALVGPAAEPGERAATEPARAAQPTCDGEGATALIKDELFRRAAVIRGREGSQVEAAAGRSMVRMQAEAAATPAPVGSGARCSGWIMLDLPPGLVVDGDRTNLNSEVHYALAARPGGGFRLAEVSGADALVASLATLANAAALEELADAPPAIVPVPPPVAPPRTVRDRPPVQQSAVPTEAAAKPPARAARVKPGCSYATGRTATAICGSANLAALDRSLAMFYDQSLVRADAARKADLLTSNDSFARRRDACRTQSCLTAAYLARMREISAIMARRPNP